MFSTQNHFTNPSKKKTQNQDSSRMKWLLLFHVIISIVFFITCILAKRQRTKNKSVQLDDENEIYTSNKKEIEEKIASLNRDSPKKFNTEHELSKKELKKLELEEISTRKKIDESTKKSGKFSLERANLLHRLGKESIRR